MRLHPFRFVAVAMAVAVALGLAVTAPTAAKSSSNRSQAERVVADVAHRGASGHAPEHTFPAYDRAIRMGTDFIEQDLQMTADGVLVVMHDTTLDRTARGPKANCTGAVGTKTLAQLKTCDMGSWFNEAYPDKADPDYVGLEIPTLREVFARYGHRVNYYIETKSPSLYPEMEDELLSLMDEFHLLKPARKRWQVLIQSFSETSLRQIDAAAPELPLVQLVSGSATSDEIRVDAAEVATYAEGLGPSHRDVDAGVVEAAHRSCLAVHPYTVNDVDDMTRLIEIGVDGMFTNFPDKLNRVLGHRAVHGKRAALLAKRAHDACVA